MRGACEILGLDPLYVANEGKAIAFVAPEAADEALALWRRHPLGRQAVVIGEVAAAPAGLVTLRSSIGGSRIVDLSPASSCRGSAEAQPGGSSGSGAGIALRRTRRDGGARG